MNKKFLSERYGFEECGMGHNSQGNDRRHNNIHKDCFPLKNTGSKIKYFCQSISKKENLEGHLRGQ